MADQSRITRRELAQRLGVGESSIRAAEARKRITIGADGLFDAAEAVRDWDQNRRGKPGPGRPPKVRPASPASTRPVPGERLIDIQARHEKVKLAERQLKLARMREELVDRKAVEKRVFELIRAERERLLNWPADEAPRLAAVLGADPVRVEIELERAVRKLLASLTAPTLAVPASSAEAAA